MREPLEALAAFFLEKDLEQSRKGIIVWAKLDGHPPWPAMVVPKGFLPANLRGQGSIYVNFFGTQTAASFGIAANMDKIFPFHDYYEVFSNTAMMLAVGAASAKAKASKSQEPQRQKAVALAVEMQAHLGSYVSKVLASHNAEAKPSGPGNAEGNACYCIYCFDGGDLVLCSHCPAAAHPHCAGLKAPPSPHEHHFCSPCLKYHLGLILAKISELPEVAAAPAGNKGKKMAAELKRHLLKNNYPAKDTFVNELETVAARVFLECKDDADRKALEIVKSRVRRTVEAFCREGKQGEGEV